MSGKKRVFFDTNILIYAYSSDEIQKRLAVQNLIETHGDICISTQVINEFINVMRKKKAVPIDILKGVMQEIVSLCTVSLVTLDTIDRALETSKMYNYSYFDSLMISSAIENSCVILYSEDMHHKHMVRDSLIIVNPFTL